MFRKASDCSGPKKGKSAITPKKRAESLERRSSAHSDVVEDLRTTTKTQQNPKCG